MKNQSVMDCDEITKSDFLELFELSFLFEFVGLVIIFNNCTFKLVSDFYDF